jgi:hypothetical protein
MTLNSRESTRLKAWGLRALCPSVFSPDFLGLDWYNFRLTFSLNLQFDLRLGGYIPYGMRFSKSHFPYGFLSWEHEYYWIPSREALGDAWGLLEKTLILLKDQLEYLPASRWFKHSWGLRLVELGMLKDYSPRPSRLLEDILLATKYSGACCTDIPRPTAQVDPRNYSTWAARH